MPQARGLEFLPDKTRGASYGLVLDEIECNPLHAGRGIRAREDDGKFRAIAQLSSRNVNYLLIGTLYAPQRRPAITLIG